VQPAEQEGEEAVGGEAQWYGKGAEEEWWRVEKRAGWVHPQAQPLAAEARAKAQTQTQTLPPAGLRKEERGLKGQGHPHHHPPKGEEGSKAGR
jgi:hypothetical protein